MNDEHDDPRLRELMSDAVSDVEPRDALPEIRSAIRSRTQEAPVPSQSSSSRWTYAFTGALLAAAVIVAVFLLFDPPGGDDDGDPGPAAGPTATPTDEATDKPSDEPSASPSAEPSSEPEPGGGEEATAAVYYMADTRGGPRLFREFQVVKGTDAFDRGLILLQSAPKDPDYTSAWPEGSLTGAVIDGDVIRVTVSGPSLRAIPQGMSEEEAAIAVEQVIYTMQAAAQERAPVQFMLDGNPVDQVYGVPTSEPLANGPALEVLNLMSVTSPEQGATVSGSMDISGVANSFEANVQWEILGSGGKVVDSGFVTAEGWMGEKLFPWSDTVDVSDLAPGEYTFVAQTDDPSGGAEGTGPAVDTKRFTVE
jgi:hypothetical protein